MPKREVTSAPWVPVPARACTGKAPRARQHRAVGRLSAGAPRLHKSCRLRRPQSKGRSCRSGRARRDPRARGGRRHLSERPGWPSGAPISRGSTVSMIAFGGRQGPHRSGSRCRGRPIERREAGREGCLWPNAASQGRPPDGSGGESERSTQNGRAKTLCGGGGGGGGGGSNSELPQAGFPESGEVPDRSIITPPHSQPRALRHTSLSVMRHKKSHKVRLSRRLNASTSLGAHHPCTPPTTSGSSGRARPVTIASQVGLSCAVGRWLGLGLASPKRKGTR